MQMHQLKRRTKNKKKMTVGRGGTRGKTSGRGTKGQNSRAGRKKRPELRDIIKKLPKQRGRGKNIFKSFQDRAQIIKLSILENITKTGDVVTPNYLAEKGLLKASKGFKVKILGVGEISKAITISGCAISLSAKQAILKAGGKIE